MARRARYRYTAKRARALKRAQAISARKRSGRARKLAIVGGGVVAAGVGAAVLGRQLKGRGHPRQVINSAPPQANQTNDPTRMPWHIGDSWDRLKMGDVVEVSLKNKISGKGFTRTYGLFERTRPTRHSTQYRVTVKVPGKNGGWMRNEWVNESDITGVKVKGASNFINSVNSLIDERKRHRW